MIEDNNMEIKSNIAGMVNAENNYNIICTCVICRFNC